MDLRDCPFCANSDLAFIAIDGELAVRCPECGATGPRWSNAAFAWNQRYGRLSALRTLDSESAVAQRRCLVPPRTKRPRVRIDLADFVLALTYRVGQLGDLLPFAAMRRGLFIGERNHADVGGFASIPFTVSSVVCDVDRR